jgi:hypothetical protein
MDETNTCSLKVYSDEWRINALRAGRKFVQGRGYRVYYPGSSTDISASKAFPASHVSYVDRDPKAIELLRVNGYRAAFADANRATLKGAVDVILIFNSGIYPGHVCEFLRKGGCLFCNNDRLTAVQARLVEDLDHVASVRNEAGKTVVDEDENHLWEYWQYIDTEEEFARADVTGTMRDAVQRFMKRNGDYLQQYRELYARSIPDSIRRELSAMPDPPNYGSSGYSPQTYHGPVFADPKDRTSRLQPLPMKRGDADTVFVFRKV